jgi:hypothetical protein
LSRYQPDREGRHQRVRGFLTVGITDEDGKISGVRPRGGGCNRSRDTSAIGAAGAVGVAGEHRNKLDVWLRCVFVTVGSVNTQHVGPLNSKV